MMYFSSASKVNDGSVPGAEYSSNATNLFYRFYLGIAISDTPVGPFTLVTAKDYYGEEKPNLNGDIITDINPPINIQNILIFRVNGRQSTARLLSIRTERCIYIFRAIILQIIREIRIFGA